MPGVFAPEFRATLLAGGETLELVMFDFIGADFFDEGITDKMVQRALSAAPNAKTINIRMNSPGGDAFMGFTIANLLRAHAARKEMDVEGACASAATAIAMACVEVRMWPGSQMMIHQARGSRGRATANEMRASADMLEGINNDVAKMYAAKTGKAEVELLQMMAAETWLTAQKAVDQRFADKLVEAKPKAQALAMMRVGIERCGYSNVPPELKAAAESPAQQETDMNKKAIAKLLGISENASDDAFEDTLRAKLDDGRADRAQLGKYDTITGKSGDEAYGVVLAWKQSHEELPKATETITQLRAKTDDSEIDAAIAKAKAESRWTPARETKVRELLKAKDLTAGGAKAMVGAWEVVTAIAAGKDGAKAATGAGDGVDPAGTGAQLTWNGKTYAELKPIEREQLANENRELFNQMRGAHKPAAKKS